MTALVKSELKHKVVVGLGSNLNHPKQQILAALEAVSRLSETKLDQVSSYYSSKPQGPQDQPEFVNAVATFFTNNAPEEFLKALQSIEKRQGKDKIRHWGERLIDLDILLFDELQWDSESLKIPHPEMVNRDFVLVPLAEILPDCYIPAVGQVKDLIIQLPETYLIQA